jgi:hypothetical protein
METLSIINYLVLALTTAWTLFILFNLQSNCQKQCDFKTIKQCISTYFFGLVLIFILYYANKWVLTGQALF